MRRYVVSKDVIIVLIQMVSITHPLFDAVRFFGRRAFCNRFMLHEGKMHDKKTDHIDCRR